MYYKSVRFDDRKYVVKETNGFEESLASLTNFEPSDRRRSVPFLWFSVLYPSTISTRGQRSSSASEASLETKPPCEASGGPGIARMTHSNSTQHTRLGVNELGSPVIPTYRVSTFPTLLTRRQP